MRAVLLIGWQVSERLDVVVFVGVAQVVAANDYEHLRKLRESATQLVKLKPAFGFQREFELILLFDQIGLGLRFAGCEAGS